MFEDHPIARNELDQLNNRDDDEILLRGGSNFADNPRMLRFNRFSLKLKLLITLITLMGSQSDYPTDFVTDYWLLLGIRGLLYSLSTQ